MPVESTATLVFVGESAKAPKTKALTEPRAEAARAFVKEAMVKRAVNQVAYAESIGFSQQQLNDFLNRKTQGGLAFVEAVADREGVSIDEVIGRASALSVPVTVKERAATAAKLLGYSPDVIEQGVFQATEHEDARSILRRIQRIDIAPPATGEDKSKRDALPSDPREALATAVRPDEESDLGKT